MLFSFIGMIISFSVHDPINCGVLFTFNSILGNLTILSASTSLMLRTVALWERKRRVIVPLGFLTLTHWILLIRNMFIVRAVWDSNLGACVVVSTNSSLLNVTFFFTMGFDLVILIATAVAVMSRHSARTDLWKLLFADGLCYFVVSFSMNCIPAVLNLLNLNAPMNVIATIPAAAISSMAACRAVMRLLDFNANAYIHSLGAVIPSSDMPVPRFTFPTTLPTVYSKNDLHRYDVEAGRQSRDVREHDSTYSMELEVVGTLGSCERTTTR
ncbi:hypothetical protein R3P38DRAFT_2830137 [Favolaschia claudopus]|uniref:Uncharacterized protein n=1 Tax=Favolaschia claudopus TaxID=2862362 RepID=A0AAW0E829_9AGAR